MKIDISCMKCVQEHRALQGLNQIQTEAELTDDGFFKGVCKNGHEIISVLQNPKYELLFDLAGLALLDGYTREAVSSFAVALERFYEFFIKVAFIHNKRDEAIFDSYWKIVANQSERQIGCFLTSYIELFKELPPMPSETDVSLRNKVVHKGFIASESEALDYGNKIGNQIQKIAKKLYEIDKDAFMFEVFWRLKNVTEKKKVADQQVSTMNIPTMLSTTVEGFGSNDFVLKEKIEQLKTYRTFVYSDFRKKHLDDYNYGLLKGIFGNTI